MAEVEKPTKLSAQIRNNRFRDGEAELAGQWMPGLVAFHFRREDEERNEGIGSKSQESQASLEDPHEHKGCQRPTLHQAPWPQLEAYAAL